MFAQSKTELMIPSNRRSKRAPQKKAPKQSQSQVPPAFVTDDAVFGELYLIAHELKKNKHCLSTLSFLQKISLAIRFDFELRFWQFPCATCRIVPAIFYRCYPAPSIIHNCIMNSRNQFFFQRRTLISAALGAAAFSAIGTPLTVFAAAESDPAQQLDRIKKAGIIRIGTEGVFVPYSYHDEQGRLTGYDVELARAVAAKIGVQAQFIESSWDSLLAGVDAGRFDIVVNQVEASAARRAKYDFSVPYTYDHTAILVRSDNNDIKGFDDLRGKRAAESATANSSRIAEAHGAVIVGVQDFSQAVELVVSKRADTALNSELSIADFLRKMPDVPVKVVATSTEAEEMCVLMPKGSQALKAAIDEAIESLRADGTLSKLSKQFLGRDVAVK